MLRAVANGGNIGSVAAHGDRLFAAADPPDTLVRRFDGAGRLQVEQLPSAVRRVFTRGRPSPRGHRDGLAETIE